MGSVNNVAAGPTFIELAGGENYVGTAGVWEDWDLSGIVPTGTQYVLVFNNFSIGGNAFNGVRENGSVLDRQFSITGPFTWIVHVANPITRIIEVYSDAARSHFNIMGYWL